MASQFTLKNRPPVFGFLEIAYLSEPVVQLLAFHTEFLVAGLSKKDKFPLSILFMLILWYIDTLDRLRFQALIRFTLKRAVPGKMAISNRSTVNFGTNC
jgi:hypothetical protein